MKTIYYKGHEIELCYNGMYSCNTYNGYIKSDTLKGIKKMIKELQIRHK